MLIDQRLSNGVHVDKFLGFLLVFVSCNLELLVLHLQLAKKLLNVFQFKAGVIGLLIIKFIIKVD